MASITLYVARDKLCPERLDVGSTLAIDMASRLSSEVRIVEVTRKQKSHWLTGTPTMLLDGEEESALQGTEVIQHLMDRLIKPKKAAVKQERTMPSKTPSTTSFTPIRERSGPVQEEDGPQEGGGGEEDEKNVSEDDFRSAQERFRARYGS
jgi:hypothetical protein